MNASFWPDDGANRKVTIAERLLRIDLLLLRRLVSTNALAFTDRTTCLEKVDRFVIASQPWASVRA
jgi:hypothetical protein